MTQEKELLLKDLCARLSYGVIVQWNKCDNPWIPDGKFKAEDFYRLTSPFYKIKPYLRPLSSMTEEEAMEYANCGNIIANSPQNNYLIPNPNCVDWLNAHHFDYRGLIEKGLAIEAPEGMYNIKEK